jgi:4-hydroxy-3-polyprenylbenzoate decarboxylase
MYASLRDFLGVLERSGELHWVRAEVSPLLEITEIADRHSKSPAPSKSRAAQSFDPMHANLGGKALLFEKVGGCDFPLAINVFGSYRRMEMALGCDAATGFESIAKRIASLAKPAPPRSLGDLLSKARQFLPLLRIPPKLKRSGPCQDIVILTSRGEVNLLRLPLIKCWPLDGDPRAVGCDVTAEQAGTARGEGRYITFAGMHTIHYDDRDDPKPASHNIGMYRAQLIDETHLVMHWHVHHDGAAHWRSWKRAGEKRMPIAIALGGESVLPYAATAPLPPGMSELLLAGFLNGGGIPLVKCKTVPLRVPANSEIVIEGWVSTECGDIGFDPRQGGQGLGVRDQGLEHQSDREPVANPQSPNPNPSLGPGAAFEGPFGDHTGFYSLPDRYPIVEVTAITHRRDAIFPATIVGGPPQEDYYMGKATERIFLPLLQTLIPDIEDYHLPMFGCFHNCAFIKIRKAYPLQARRVMHAVWGAGQMAWTKYIMVVDDDVNVHDEEAVLRAMFEHCHFARDLELVNGPLDILDHAAPRLGAGHKMGFDATRKIPGEEVNGIVLDSSLRIDVTPTDCNRWASANVVAPNFGEGRCAFLSVEKQGSGDGARAIQSLWSDPTAQHVNFIIAVDSTVNLRDWQSVFFHWCANTDPGRDLHRCDQRIAFDATHKLPGDERNGQWGGPVRDFPPLIEMSADIKQRIEARRAEFGL